MEPHLTFMCRVTEAVLYSTSQASWYISFKWRHDHNVGVKITLVIWNVLFTTRKQSPSVFNLGSKPGVVLHWGGCRGGAIIFKLWPCPQMWHKTLFDKLKALAYRCKKERSVAFRIRQNAFPAGTLRGSSRLSSRPLIGRREISLPILTSPRFGGHCPTPNIFYEHRACSKLSLFLNLADNTIQ